ncbi:MAG: TerB family tellurite resistance protein, partial [Pseudomonadota bacterium]
AVAALLIEAARLDGDYGAAERTRIESLLTDRFSLSPAALAALMKAATKLSDDAVDSYEFTSQIARRFDHDERIGIVEMLWDVAYADGSVHPYEANLLRRVAGLLYVTDQESGAARKRVVVRNSASPNGDDGD